jgi:hypothetical protein
MATRKLKIAKLKAHIQAICDLIDESDASMTGGQDKTLDLDGPESEVRSPQDEHQGAMDSRRGASMRQAFGPNYDRIRR